jgi:hypothetical protein
MDKLRGMETFIAVVESGSFTGAASRLEMSAVMVGNTLRCWSLSLAPACWSVTRAVRA